LVKTHTGQFSLAAQLAGVTQDLQTLSWTSPLPLADIEAVRVETVTSPSWVAWREIEVLGIDAASKTSVVVSGRR
jgi:hypothetical protein